MTSPFLLSGVAPSFELCLPSVDEDMLMKTLSQCSDGLGLLSASSVDSLASLVDPLFVNPLAHAEVIAREIANLEGTIAVNELLLAACLDDITGVVTSGTEVDYQWLLSAMQQLEVQQGSHAYCGNALASRSIVAESLKVGHVKEEGEVQSRRRAGRRGRKQRSQKAAAGPVIPVDVSITNTGVFIPRPNPMGNKSEDRFSDSDSTCGSFTTDGSSTMDICA